MAINKAKQAYIASKSANKLRQRHSSDDHCEENKGEESLRETWLKIPKSVKDK
jgi:hypothetical protein